jgi:hypothetical protein
MKVTTICYGKAQEWNNRSDALKEFRTATMMCEGSECERYQNIVWKLENGFNVADDTENWNENQQRLTIQERAI